MDATERSLAKLRREQAERVMSVVGPLLDRWENTSNDEREALEHEFPELCSLIDDIQIAVEGGQSFMKSLLEFDDPGASDDEPVKGVTVGDIRAWHDAYDRVRASWDASRGAMKAVVIVAGGVVEGHPTSELNILQRIRQLVEIERDYAKLDAAFEKHLNPPLKPNPLTKRTLEL